MTDPTSGSGTTTKLTTDYVEQEFSGMIDSADDEVANFLSAHTDSTTGELSLSTSDSLQLQQLMANQSIAAQTGTSTLKSIKDSIMAAARNI